MLVISINCENSSYLFVVRWYIYSNALHLKNVCTIDVVSMTMENLTLQTFTSFTLEEYSPIHTRSEKYKMRFISLTVALNVEENFSQNHICEEVIEQTQLQEKQVQERLRHKLLHNSMDT